MKTPAFALQISFSLAASAVTSSALAGPDPVGMGTLTPGRLGASAAALVALTGVVLGARALRAISRGAAERRGAVAALAAGLLASSVGGTIVVAAGGGVGAGQGFAGGLVALVVGLLSVALGGLARLRSPGKPWKAGT